MTTVRTSKGTSLARGPVGLIGVLLVVYGITALIFGDHGFTQHLPKGAVHGKTWLSLEVNGWSGLLFVAAGLLLLLGSPLHWGAKTMSLLVGLALGAAALVAVSKGDGVIGLLAANHITEVVWGGLGILLIVLSQLPRVGGRTRVVGSDGARARRSSRLPVGAEARDGDAAPSGAASPVTAVQSGSDRPSGESETLPATRVDGPTQPSADRPADRTDVTTAGSRVASVSTTDPRESRLDSGDE